MKIIYKVVRSVVPMILICLSVGWCYAWSLFSGPIAEHMGVSKNAVQFVFCLNILMLGLGAAFFGNFVERHIKAASAFATILLSVGFLCSAYGLHHKNMICIYAGSGLLCGTAQGIAYVISPKNLMLWWNKTKYKATVMSFSIICFGLGSSVCSVLFNKIYPICGIERTVLILCGIYACMMTLATVLINKPKYASVKAKKTSPVRWKPIIRNENFLSLWTFMFFNISAGLILIGNCVGLLHESGLTDANIITAMFACGIANGGGRLVFPILTDMMSKKNAVCLFIIAIELCLLFSAIFMQSVVPFMLILINMAYGAAFAVLPSLISYSFGTKNLTALHGMTLSAWGIASVFAYACSAAISSYNNTNGILYCVLALYAVNTIIAYFMVYVLKSSK